MEFMAVQYQGLSPSFGVVDLRLPYVVQLPHGNLLVARKNMFVCRARLAR